MPERKQWHLVCYDITEPKRWRKTFKLLKGYGEAIQYSVFRCRLNKRQLEQMRWELEKIITSDDRLLITGLCGQCASKIISKNISFDNNQEEQLFIIF